MHLHAAITSCLELTFVSKCGDGIAKINGLAMDTARGIAELFGS